MAESSEICEFYKSTNVFITGGTGFLGKILIEKLLRSTEVSTIYILIRAKKGKSIHMRLDELFDCEIFDTLKKEKPKFEHRIKVVSGDCSISDLGLCLTDRQKLISDINVVFHVAATVKFDENLKRAFNINVNGTKDLLALAKQMKNLKSFIHVSTAYSNCPSSQIDEVFYKCPYSYENIEATLEKLDEFEAAELTPKIIGQWPNTYTFTKALAESLIKDLGQQLPIGIFRPSVVISTYKEPMAGWTDHLNGPAGVAAGSISGIMRVLLCGTRNNADLVPVDSCVAGLIASAWDVAGKKEKTMNDDRLASYENIPIYNYVSSPENPVTWKEFTDYTLAYRKDFPVKNSQWAPFLLLTPNFMVYVFLKIILHIIPAIFIDSLSVIFGRRPKMMRIYDRVHRLSNIVSYFCLHEWTFSNNNTENLWRKLNRTDRELFPLSITTVHWLIYFRNYIRGVRLYLLRDPESTIEDAIKRDRMLKIVSIVLKILIIFGFCSVISFTLTQVYNFIF